MNKYNLNINIKKFILILLTILFFYRTVSSKPLFDGLDYEISLDFFSLPYYAAQSFLRMLIALVLSSIIAVCTTYNLLNSSRRVRALWINILNLCQSLPNTAFLGFLTIACTRVNFVLGSQAAVILTVVTCQVWNMIFDCYNALINTDPRYKDIIKICRLKKSTVFWRVDLPQILPALAWSSISSMSSSWFMVVASEHLILRSLSAHPIGYFVPGIGGCIYQAMRKSSIMPLVFCMLLTAANVYLYNLLINFVLQNKIYQDNIISYLENLTGQLPNKNLLKILNMTALFAFLYVIYANITDYTLEDLKHINVSLCIVKSFYTTSRVIGSILLILLVVLPISFATASKATHNSKILNMIASVPINGFYGYLALKMSNYLGPNFICVLLMSASSFIYLVNSLNYGFSCCNEEINKITSLIKISRLTKLKKILIPASVSYIFTGTTYTLGALWNSTVLCELLSWKNSNFVVNGLGEHLTNTSLNTNNLEMMLCILLMSLMSSAIFTLLNLIRSEVIRIYPQY